MRGFLACGLFDSSMGSFYFVIARFLTARKYFLYHFQAYFSFFANHNLRLFTPIGCEKGLVGDGSYWRVLLLFSNDAEMNIGPNLTNAEKSFKINEK